MKIQVFVGITRRSRTQSQSPSPKGTASILETTNPPLKITKSDKPKPAKQKTKAAAESKEAVDAETR
ncbi:unnamed protein product [Cochlearia groenlandica]